MRFLIRKCLIFISVIVKDDTQSKMLSVFFPPQREQLKPHDLE